MPRLTHHHGAQPETPDTTRFALWAPDAKTVALVLKDGSQHPLKSHPDGWFTALISCSAGTAYRFAIDDTVQVPDPASRSQLEDVHGWSQVIDHDSYAWRNGGWQGRPWHEAVIYEVHVGLLGGYAGVEARLPALAELGVTAIELMPLAEFPGARNWGYDGTLPFAPKCTYGTPDDLKRLIDTAHGLGLMVYVDVVYNHFGPDGNYLGEYASGFFRNDLHTPWGPAIDFRRPEVRDFFCENALMWILDYRVDGLRLDAVHAIPDRDFLLELAERVRAAVQPGRHVHLVLENEDNRASLLRQGFDAQWNDDGHNILHSVLTGESEGYYADFVASPTQKLARFLAEGFIYQGENTRHGHSRGEPSAHLAPTAFVLFLQNHDQVGNRAFGERLISLAPADALKAATALLLLSPMVPLLFMGEETGSRQPFFYFTDHHGELADAVREGRRNEFADFALFGDHSREQIPDPNAPATFERSRPEAEPAIEQQPWRDLYRELLQLRHLHIIPRLHKVRALGATMLAERAVCAQWELADTSVLRIDINLSEFQVKASPPWNTEPVIFNHRVGVADYEAGILPAHSVLVTLQE